MNFDSQCMIGRRCHKLEFEPWSKADLLSQMDHCGIDRALVRHAVSVEYDPAVGNDLLIEELEGENSLEPVWVLAPHETSSLEPADDMMEKMSVNGVRSVALYPNTHGYPFDEFACGDLFEALALTRTPVFLSIQEASWPSIRQILSAFPALRLVVTNLGWGALRYVYPMFEEFEELRVDTSGIRIQMGLESICERFGSHRLLFGSRWPLFAPGAALTMLNYSFLSDDERQNVASQNLTRLLDAREIA